MSKKCCYHDGRRYISRSAANMKAEGFMFLEVNDGVRQDNGTSSPGGGRDTQVESTKWISYLSIGLIIIAILLSATNIGLTITAGTGHWNSSLNLQTLRGSNSLFHVCIEHVPDNGRAPETRHLYKILERKFVHGVLKVCGKTPEQLSAIFNLVKRRRKLKKEISKLMFENSYKVESRYKNVNITTVSAHKLLYPSLLEINITEPTNVLYNTALMNPDGHNVVTEHARGVMVSNDSLIIQYPGTYYVYSGVTFKPASDRPAREFKYRSWSAYVRKNSPQNPQNARLLLRATHTVCDDCEKSQETSFAGGIFYLEARDEIQVFYSCLGVTKYNTESTFLGLMMIDSQKPDYY